MTDYDTSWVPEGYTLTVTKRRGPSEDYRDSHSRYGAHLVNKDDQDPLNLRFHFLGDSGTKVIQPGFWAKLFGKKATTEETFRPLVVGVELPTDAHVVDAFERLRKKYEMVKDFNDAEAKILGTYPPNIVKVPEAISA